MTRGLSLVGERRLWRIRGELVNNRVSITHFLVRSRSVQSFQSLQLICVMIYRNL
jgi:hypothetical protein